MKIINIEKIKKSNIPIEGMTTVELEEKIKAMAETDEVIKDIVDRNQYKFITKFFSEFIMEDGKYIKGTKLSDLLILYYIDYYIKLKLAHIALKIERYINIIMLNLHDEGVISEGTGDKHNTFRDKYNFFNQKLNSKEQEKVIDRFNKVYDTNFSSIKSFINNLDHLVNLRNFTLHHYSVVSYTYAGKIKNGDSHINKNGKDILLKDVINSVSNFINEKTSENLMRKISGVIQRYNFSNPIIKELVTEKLFDVLNFDALKKIKRTNVHYSIIDFIKIK